MKEKNFPVGWAVTSGEERLLTLPLSTILKSTLITGSTGYGKSALILSLILTALTKFRRRTEDGSKTPPIGVVLQDCKGETASELVTNWLPSLVEKHPYLDPSNIVVIRPFGRKFGIPLNPLYPIQGLDASVQGYIVASLIADLAEGNVGPRMKSLLAKLCHAGILARVLLLDLLKALREEREAVALASRVPDPELRHYLTEVLPREPAASKDALCARLEWLLLIPEVRVLLNAPTAVSGSDMLEALLTIIDLGGDVPMGFLPLVQFVGAYLTIILTAAVFCRAVPAHPVMFIIDEWQVVVSKSAAELERTLSQARFRQVNLILANQTLGQITDASLLRSLLTNISLHWAFRPNEKDIDHVLPLLPITGRCLDPEHPDAFLPKEAERRRLLERLAKLPPRHALLADHIAGTAQIVRTMAIPYAEAQRLANAVPASLRENYLRGRFGVPFNELLRLSERRDTASVGAQPLSVQPLSVSSPTKPTRATRARLVLP